MKLKWIVMIVAVLAAVVLCLVFGNHGEGEQADVPKTNRYKLQHRQSGERLSAKEAVRRAIDGRVPKSSGRKSERFSIPDHMFDDLKPADQKLARAVQNALDQDNFDGVARAAEKAAKSADPEVRKLAVDALGWFGAEALPELTVFMSDRDEEVASAAADQWQLALSMVEDEPVRVSTAEAALKTLSNEDALQMIASEITSQDDDLKVMQSLVDIIDSGNEAGVRIAKEEYETLTGEEWKGVDAAEAWLQENYEPSKGESDEGE